MGSSGRDVTDLFRAADRALTRAVEAGVALAVPVDGSPTCGSSRMQAPPSRGAA